MTITIISIGGESPTNIVTLIKEYIDRLPSQISVKWIYLKHGHGDKTSSLNQESESILKAIPKKNKIILLDEIGEQFTSPRLSNLLFSTSQDTTFIIGGAYGVNSKIKNSVDNIWSLSGLVFPHKLVRLILAEQIYRAHSISIGHPYHHE